MLVILGRSIRRARVATGRRFWRAQVGTGVIGAENGVSAGGCLGLVLARWHCGHRRRGGDCGKWESSACGLSAPCASRIWFGARRCIGERFFPNLIRRPPPTSGMRRCGAAGPVRADVIGLLFRWPQARLPPLCPMETRGYSAPGGRERNQRFRRYGWGARIRTWEWRYQKPLPYHLATPQDDALIRKARVAGNRAPPCFCAAAKSAQGGIRRVAKRAPPGYSVGRSVGV